MAELLKHWNDISFAVSMTREVGDPLVRFKSYEIVGYRDLDANAGHIYHLENYSDSEDTTEAIEQAHVFLSGSIKWDGCADMRFDELERVELHFCGKSDAERIGALLTRLYELAAEIMPEHAEELK